MTVSEPRSRATFDPHAPMFGRYTAHEFVQSVRESKEQLYREILLAVLITQEFSLESIAVSLGALPEPLPPEYRNLRHTLMELCIVGTQIFIRLDQEGATGFGDSLDTEPTMRILSEMLQEFAGEDARRWLDGISREISLLELGLFNPIQAQNPASVAAQDEITVSLEPHPHAQPPPIETIRSEEVAPLADDRTPGAVSRPEDVSTSLDIISLDEIGNAHEVHSAQAASSVTVHSSAVVQASPDGGEKGELERGLAGLEVWMERIYRAEPIDWAALNRAPAIPGHPELMRTVAQIAETVESWRAEYDRLKEPVRPDSGDELDLRERLEHRDRMLDDQQRRLLSAQRRIEEQQRGLEERDRELERLRILSLWNHLRFLVLELRTAIDATLAPRGLLSRKKVPSKGVLRVWKEQLVIIGRLHHTLRGKLPPEDLRELEIELDQVKRSLAPFIHPPLIESLTSEPPGHHRHGEPPTGSIDAHGGVLPDKSGASNGLR